MIENPETYFLLEKKRMRIAFVPVFVFICLLWIVFILDSSLQLQLYQYGVYPHSKQGLLGILLSPLIHGSMKHLFSNTLPLLVLMWCLYYFYSSIANKSFVLLWLLSGFFTWLIAREAWHIGASGIIYSLSFFLFFSGIIRGHIPLIAISLIVAFMYGSGVWNMFPWAERIDTSVSWEGHLAGGVSGLIVAIIYRKHGPQKPTKVWDEEDEDTDDDGSTLDTQIDDVEVLSQSNKLDATAETL